MTCFTLVVFYAKRCIERNAIKIADILHKKQTNENELDEKNYKKFNDEKISNENELDDKNDEKSYGEKISN